MRVERSGSQRWLVIQESPDRLWPLVKEFWQENGFLINLELPEAGVMETDWAENRAKIPQDWLRSKIGGLFDSLYATPERDKFRTRFERSADGKSTEIYVSHRGMVENYKDERTREGGTVWNPRPSDPELEAEFLRRLMVRLGTKEEVAKQSIAVAKAPPQRAEIKKGLNGAELLQVFEPFDRTWRRVGLALDRVGFTVEDRDRQKGLYFVRYADPEAEPGKRKKEGSVLSRLFTRSDEKVKAEQYRVQVKQAQDNSEIQVFNKDGAPENSQTTRRILALLHEQLK
jgi:outer membrane protein assembly factor BamC